MIKGENYSLNGETLNFILDFETNVEKNKVYTNQDLVELFRSSTFYNEVVDSYYKTAIQKSIWWAVKRSGKWQMERGKYTKL
ncbi:hypothetical protein CN689_08735 [Peribacillus butanolivorans]|uniref:Uncharacterized protein n=1 Tax=Peribacillus butanolivorans TaxID=421767 RepID=A0AAX0S381_9BACI|nr:hypothetical protein [Peribacillus butanolivorans]PEJ34219.1 hypothetical protein CN689_08735 [Peribacillus butanolivorans]